MERRGGGVVLGVRILSRKLAPACAACLALALEAGPAAAQPFDILQQEKVVAGMKGKGVTDMGDGKGIQRFDVEILGLLKRYAPGQDLILGRVSGIGLENAGIIAGMSGSPIYVDGKLVGALAYGWPFSKDPICGITPIQSMLDIRHAPAAPPVPTAGTAASKSVEEPSPLKPGSAVATQLLSGDMDLSATGTVTWVEGNSVLAFGHPFLSMGPVSMPMSQAQVLTVLPSLFRSFKFAATGPVLGSITQDRSTGILGTFGTHAPMVPITVRISSDQIPSQVYHFQAVHNSMLTPILTAIAIDNVLTTLEKRSGERTLVWKSAIRTPGRNVRWDSVFSGLNAREEAVASLALLTNYLMANEFHDLTILGVDVEITHSDRLKGARIVHVEAQKERVHPGDEVPIWVDVVDFRGSARRVVLNLKVAPDTPPGPLTVFVGDGSAATAYDLALVPPDPQSLDQVLDFLARVRPPNSLNLLAYRSAPGAVVAGDALQALPPSVATLLRDRGPGEASTPELSHARLQSVSVEQPTPVNGSVRLRIDVKPRMW